MPIVKFEDMQMNIVSSTFDEIHGVSLCCIVMNEESNLIDFFEWHKPYVDNIIVVDGGSSDNSFDICSRYSTEIRLIKFAGHYGNQKNRAIELARNDWVLFVDPDERMSVDTMKNLRNLINQDTHDCYSFPRKNMIDGVPDMSHGADHQLRLFRSYCRYVRPTHEELVGFKNCKRLEDSSSMNIIHYKKSKRHDFRNKLYGLFDIHYVREFGAPGSQLRDSFARMYPGLTRARELLIGKESVVL